MPPKVKQTQYTPFMVGEIRKEVIDLEKEKARLISMIEDRHYEYFRETGKKRKLLEILDYTHLTGRNGERIPLEDCSDARIGRAFRNMYRTAQRFLGEPGEKKSL